VPFAETRPLGGLLFGTRTLAERIEDAAGLKAGGDAPGDAEPGADAPAFEIRVDPRFVPDRRIPMEAIVAQLRAGVDGPLQLVTATGQVAGSADLVSPAPPDRSPPSGSGGTEPRHFVIHGALLASPWDLMEQNGERITRDLLDAPPSDARPLSPLPPGVFVLGSYPVTVGADVEVDPQVVLDARKGPIHLADGVRVQALTRLEGPAWIGSRSRLQGGVFSNLSVGPVCRLRGEIEATVINGWCNKAHDGYLGHAVLGRWVNLGAFTTNSDLKNTYGSVRVPLSATETEDTGLLKIGVLLGDHVKTGIGTLLNTGTVVGAGSTLFAGGGLPPRWVPPFSWGAGEDLTAYRLEAFLTVAERAMARRDVDLSDSEREALVGLWEATHGEGSDSA
jgi:UDP-N-acetylglucosamine diphosphorylase / glucose-1-phosphate thymidylyltransferase / UDP-N-acetylgalactosamine diphosphorylase / glucosamine-1-phosphate N-acetyltransferase / galactosamine-1-phosphate N-acetyltransferase